MANSESNRSPNGPMPAGLFPMGNLFRLTEPGAGPLWLLDAGGGNPKMVFVPAAAVQ